MVQFFLVLLWYLPVGFFFPMMIGSGKESAPQVLLPEEEKIIVEETKSNGQTVIEEK